MPGAGPGRARRARRARAAVGRARPAVARRPRSRAGSRRRSTTTGSCGRGGCASATSTSCAGSAGVGGCAMSTGAVRPRRRVGHAADRAGRARRRRRTGRAARGPAAAAEAGSTVVLVEAEPATVGGRWRGWSDGCLDRRSSRRRLVRRDRSTAGTTDGRRDRRRLRDPRRAVVAATGSYERVPLVPGADRPGVMAARTVIGLIERYGVLPGRRALLVGTGQELATAGERLAGPASSVPTVRSRRRRSSRSAAGDRVTGADDRHQDGDRGATRRRSRRVRRSAARTSTSSSPPAPPSSAGATPSCPSSMTTAGRRVASLSVVGLGGAGDSTRARVRPRDAPRPPTGRWSASARTSAPARSAPSRRPATPTRSSSSAGRAP